MKTPSTLARKFRQTIPCALAMLAATKCSSALAADGYATINGDTTGGQAGPAVTVTNAADFMKYAKTNVPYVVQVEGTIITNSVVSVRPDKTIIGLGTNATFIGRLNLSSGVSNIVVRNLFITSPGADGITIDDAAHHIWVDHCTFFDCGDGEVDITLAADFVTVSWCKFYYVSQSSHRFVNLVGGADGDLGDSNKLHVTFHHNWWGALCHERMPRVRFGQNHIYNNYYACPSNSYCVGVGNDCQILLENNCFDNVNNAWENYSGGDHQGLIQWNDGNVFTNGTTMPTWASNSTVVAPPYSWTLDAAAGLPGLVTNNAGAGKLVLGSTPFEQWQVQYFECTLCPQAQGDADPDGDGMNNEAEFLSGTDPTNGASALRVLSVSRQSTNVVIAWATAGGRTNAVQATTGGVDGSYSNDFADITLAPQIIIPGSGAATTNYVDEGGATNSPSRFYRIRLVP